RERCAQLMGYRGEKVAFQSVELLEAVEGLLELCVLRLQVPKALSDAREVHAAGEQRLVAAEQAEPEYRAKVSTDMAHDLVLDAGRSSEDLTKLIQVEIRLHLVERGGDLRHARGKKGSKDDP